MAHSVGALLLPAPVPDEREDSLTDPMLDVLAPFFGAVLKHYFGQAWSVVAPNEPVVRTIRKHDPEEMDFSENDLPLLCVWREADQTPKHLADLHGESESVVRVLWVPPPGSQDKRRTRHAFFNAFKSAVALAVQNQRDPCWRHPADIESDSDEAEAYGSDVLALAGLSWWRQQGTTRTPVVVPSGGNRLSYNAYVANLLVGEMTANDETAFGVYPTVIGVNQRTGGEPSRTIFDSLVPPQVSSQ